MMLRPQFANMPVELRHRPRWVVWAGRKVPYCARKPEAKASSINPATWSPFEDAQVAYGRGRCAGVGFVLNNDGIVGIDLDKCVVDDIPQPQAVRLLDDLGCGYIERSPSGSGLRGFGYGPQITGVRGVHNDTKVELYSGGRYLTVTGHAIKAGPLTELSGFTDLARLLRDTPTEEDGSARKGTDDHGGEQKGTEDDLCFLPISSVGVKIHEFLPTEEGQRNQRLFRLARHLKGFVPDATKSDLRPIIQEWHRLAEPVIGTKDFALTWSDFLRGYDKVRTPHGTVITSALKDIDWAVPESMRPLGYGENCRRLVSICRSLQQHAGTEPFFLSARKAGELLGIHFTDAARYLHCLTQDGVLELVSKGVGVKASRYRWAWPS